MNKLSCPIHNKEGTTSKFVNPTYWQPLKKWLHFVRLNCGLTCVHPKKKMKANWA